MPVSASIFFIGAEPLADVLRIQKGEYRQLGKIEYGKRYICVQSFSAKGNTGPD